MTNRLTEPNRRIQGRDDHYCFGCGALNPHGLHLTFYEREDEQGVWSPWTPTRVHEGYAGIVHGGVITAVLDEVMAWSLYGQEIWAVTAKIEVAFRQPVEVGVPTRVLARTAKVRGRLIDMFGELRRTEDDLLLASARATFVRVPDEQAAAWKKRYFKVDART